MTSKYILLSIFFAMSLTILKAQEETVIKIGSQQASKSEIFINIEQNPEFPGGKEGLMKFYKTTSLFSICHKKENNCRTLYYQIVVDTIGKIEDFKIIKGINEKLDNDTERIVKKMPKWTPGKEKGKPVKVLVTLEIKYKSVEY